MENYQNSDCSQSTHNHEVQGSVQVAGPDCEIHNHRFATISGNAIQMGTTHVHEVTFDTDTYEGHKHEFCGRTCPAVYLGDGHVHYLESVTTREDGHVHKFRVITHIEDPTEE